jgi:hypothetical protein
MNDYKREKLRTTMISIIRKRTPHQRDDVKYVVAHHLGDSE